MFMYSQHRDRLENMRKYAKTILNHENNCKSMTICATILESMQTIIKQENG